MFNKNKGGYKPVIKPNIEQTVLESDRLVLRAFLRIDLNDFHEFTSDSGVLEMAGKKHNESLSDSHKMLESFIASKSVFAITLKDINKVIGFIGFYKDTRIRDDEKYTHLKALEIDYLVSKKYWGKGIATEAVKAVADYCFNVLKLDALIATYAVNNLQSKRVAEKSGFRYIKSAVFYSEADKCCHNGAMAMLFQTDNNFS